MPQPTTLYEYYTQKGETLPTIKERGKLFEQFGLGPAESYTGTMQQNIALLGKLLASTPTPTPAPIPTPTPKPTSASTPTPTPTFTPTPTPTDEKVSASFMAKQLEEMKALFTKMAEAYPKPEITTAELEKSKQLERERIARAYEMIREEAISAKEAGMREIERTGEVLRIPEVQVPRRIEDFQKNTETFISNFNKQMERLNEEENAAISANDLNYAQQIRQTKLDYFNFQRQVLSDNWNIVSGMFNMATQMKQYEQGQAQNRLNLVMQSYSGQNWDTIPDDEKSLILKDASLLGIGIDTIKQIISTPQMAQTVKAGNYVYVLDSRGSVINKISAPDTSVALTSVDIQSELTNLVNQINLSDDKESLIKNIPNDLVPFIKLTKDSITGEIKATMIMPTQKQYNQIISRRMAMQNQGFTPQEVRDVETSTGVDAPMLIEAVKSAILAGESDDMIIKDLKDNYPSMSERTILMAINAARFTLESERSVFTPPIQTSEETKAKWREYEYTPPDLGKLNIPKFFKY